MRLAPVPIFSAIAAITVHAHVTGRAALFTTDALEITRLLLTDVERGNTTLQFDVYDPNPLTLARTTCSGSWPHAGAFPADYTLCRNSSFTWRLDDFTSTSTFTIGLTHVFTDPSIGDPPYDRVRIFAKAPLNETLLVASENGTTVEQRSGTILYAPVYAAVA